MPEHFHGKETQWLLKFCEANNAWSFCLLDGVDDVLLLPF